MRGHPVVRDVLSGWCLLSFLCKDEPAMKGNLPYRDTFSGIQVVL